MAGESWKPGLPRGAHRKMNAPWGKDHGLFRNGSHRSAMRHWRVCHWWSAPRLNRGAETAADGVRSVGMFRPRIECRAGSGTVATTNPARFHQTGEPTSPQGRGLATAARNGTVWDAEWAKQANFAKPPDLGSSKNGCRPTAIEKRLER
jgi:hypothetical protein